MKLYEATNGFVGESYVRAYVWAENEEQAKALAKEAFDNHASYRGSQVSLRLLFSSSVKPFCTEPSDAGWEFK